MIFTKLENIALCLFNMGQELFWRNILLKQLMFSLIGNNTKCISKVVGLMELIIARKKFSISSPLPSIWPSSFPSPFLFRNLLAQFWVSVLFHFPCLSSHFHFLQGKSCFPLSLSKGQKLQLQRRSQAQPRTGNLRTGRDSKQITSPFNFK